jgi:hypothetical protein
VDPTSLRRIYRVKAPGKLGYELNDAVQNIACGRVSRFNAAVRNCSGAVSSLVVWSAKSLLVCTVVGSDVLSVISLLNGDLIVQLAGHISPITSLAASLSAGVVATGSEDKTVRIWRASECIPHRLAVLGAFEDVAVSRLEQRVVSTSVGPGSRQILRTLASQLSARLKLQPAWRIGKVVSFFDGKRFSGQPMIEQLTAVVEVCFENSLVQLYANRTMLRSPREAVRAPSGPPFWSEPEAPLVLGAQAAVYDFDPEAAAIACARAMGVAAGVALPFSTLRSLFNALMEPVGGFEGLDITAALQAAGLEPSDSISGRPRPHGWLGAHRQYHLFRGIQTGVCPR